MDKDQPLKSVNFPLTLKAIIWLMGAIAWFFGIVDRAFAAFADGHLSLQDEIQLFIVIFFFLIWFYLKPKFKIDSQFLARLNNSLR
jgi:hypothetical protein